MVDLHKRWI